MFFVYILHSETSNQYYIGHSDDPQRRLIEHNDPKYSKYTSKFKPWTLKAKIKIWEDRGVAMKVETYLKSQKSRKIIEQVIERQYDEAYVKYIIEKTIVG